ncbi:hypothetical protein JNM87_02495 [Candidatus Saccharibacteria bacterium]|nr:hypothetical protein [Candidatus Saccharibacteria bacterium]
MSEQGPKGQAPGPVEVNGMPGVVGQQELAAANQGNPAVDEAMKDYNAWTAAWDSVGQAAAEQAAEINTAAAATPAEQTGPSHRRATREQTTIGEPESQVTITGSANNEQPKQAEASSVPQYRSRRERKAAEANDGQVQYRTRRERIDAERKERDAHKDSAELAVDGFDAKAGRETDAKARDEQPQVTRGRHAGKYKTRAERKAAEAAEQGDSPIFDQMMAEGEAKIEADVAAEDEWRNILRENPKRVRPNSEGVIDDDDLLDQAYAAAEEFNSANEADSEQLAIDTAKKVAMEAGMSEDAWSKFGRDEQLDFAKTLQSTKEAFLGAGKSEEEWDNLSADEKMNLSRQFVAEKKEAEAKAQAEKDAKMINPHALAMPGSGLRIKGDELDDSLKKLGYRDNKKKAGSAAGVVTATPAPGNQILTATPAPETEVLTATPAPANLVSRGTVGAMKLGEKLSGPENSRRRKILAALGAAAVGGVIFYFAKNGIHLGGGGAGTAAEVANGAGAGQHSPDVANGAAEILSTRLGTSVEKGSGYINEISQMFGGAGVKINGGQASEIYNHLQSTFPDGNFFSEAGESYTRGAGDFGITAPGTFHWRPEVAAEMLKKAAEMGMNVADVKKQLGVK